MGAFITAKRARSGFSLLELLVSIAVVAILIGASYAGFQQMDKERKALRCLGNLRAIGTAGALYSAENGGALPQSSHLGPARAWQKVLPPYMGGHKEVFKSPLSPSPTQPYSYAINDFITSRPYGAETLDFSRRQSFDSPASTLFFSLVTKEYGKVDHFHFADGSDGGFTPDAFRWQVAVELNHHAGHYLFVDGHVEAIPWAQIRTELLRQGSRFIRPDGNP